MTGCSRVAQFYGIAAWSEERKLGFMTNGEKRELKAQAQRLDPVLKVGHAGVSDEFLTSLDIALTRHSLVKIKFTDCKREKKALAPRIAAKTASELIMRVGNVAVYFRPRTTD